MKRFLLIATILSCAVALSAGTLDKVVTKITNAGMATTNSTATTSKITGYVNRLDVVVSLITNVNLSVTASNEFTGLTTTLLAYTPIAANTSYQLTNYVQRLTLLDEIVTISTTNAATSNQNVTVTVIYERP